MFYVAEIKRGKLHCFNEKFLEEHLAPSTIILSTHYRYLFSQKAITHLIGLSQIF